MANIDLEKLTLLYEGKAKQVYATDNKDEYIVHYKDDATAFNGEKHDTILGKGVLNNKISSFFFELLKKEGVPTHFVRREDDRNQTVLALKIVPLEVIVRNIAAGSAPSFGDRKSYQMDFHNRKEALKEAQLDVAEGADIIMVKPAMTYLDIVREVADTVNVPVAAYSVSGEYAMVKAGAKLGCVDEEKIVCEMATGVYRAGACVYLTYFAKEIAGYIEKGYIG